MKSASLVHIALTPAVLIATTAHAQEAPPAVAADAGQVTVEGDTEATTEPEEGARKPGWSPGLAIGAGFNLIDNRAVVGQQEGTTLTLSGGLDAALEFNQDMHEWRNALLASAGVARTPSIDEYLKTDDGLAFETAYLLHLI
ncbi:MAG: hypothetical protein JRI23_04415 [Deltaproteobacteria bacterium]|jgi:hypothetical protein|nr:hypothetical protein [Deltaproteobacteria bacterium]MBW2530784.1 hypothetical protein [Deltaproteobacteria bacterium]